MNSHVEFRLEFRTDSSSDSVSIALTVIDAFVISVRHSISREFVTSTSNHVIFLGSNKTTCTLKLKWLCKQCTVPLNLAWWHTFLFTWNGLTHSTPAHLVIQTDASSTWGCRAIFNKSWFQWQWPSN